MKNYMTILSLNKLGKILKKSPLECTLIGIVVLVLGYATLPEEAQADVDFSFANDAISLEIKAIQNEFANYGILPESGERGPSYTMTVSSTAYNSLPGQTDSTPDVTASGTKTRHGVVAANFLPIGTRIKIPELYGDQVFIVEDRMNPRYWYKVDIWMEDYDDAIQYGVQNIEIEVYPNS